MELKNGSWNMWSYRSLNNRFQNGSFVFAADNNKDFSAVHDSADTHGVSLAGNIFFLFKESLICLDSLLSKIYTVSGDLEMISRFIKSDMSVVTESEDLNISRTCLLKLPVILSTGSRTVCFSSVRNKSTVMRDIYLMKKITVHKITITLRISSGKPFVFIKIDSCDL